MRRPPSPAQLLARKVVKVARQGLRRLRGTDRRVIHLEPLAPARGRVLFSYLVEPFLRRPGEPPGHDHTRDWEMLDMVAAWRERGHAVDVISWENDGFLPARRYDVLIDARYNLERLAPLLDPACLRIMHIDAAHHSFHNAAEAGRLARLEGRRGVRLRPRRYMPPGRGIETADCGIVLGNEFTMSTFAFAGKPLFRVPISTPLTYPAPDDKDFAAARRRFVWFGSGGLVHKGLDLVLEAFAAAPELELAVCGPVENEDDFLRAYRRELYHTPNIHLIDWIDIASPQFADLASRSLAVVYPSSSEGGGGSVTTCMHAGLVPVVTREASVDVDPGHGILLESPSVEHIRDAVRALAARPPEQLRAMARRAWEFVRGQHTREHFARTYRDTLERIQAEVRSPRG